MADVDTSRERWLTMKARRDEGAILRYDVDRFVEALLDERDRLEERSDQAYREGYGDGWGDGYGEGDDG